MHWSRSETTFETAAGLFDGLLDLDPAKPIFLDEIALSTKMSRPRGRSQCGERCRSAVAHGHWKTTTFTGALRLSGMTAPMVLDGPMTGVAFLAYAVGILHRIQALAWT